LRFSNRCLTLLTATVVSIALLTGCDRRTPEERLATAVQFYQQQDAASAEMEALKVVEKAPGEVAGIQASMLLARIYAEQNRMDEAEAQLESSLEHVSQLEPAGKEVLQTYLAVLNGQQKYKKALEVVDKYQEEYAEDPGTSLSLKMAGVEIRTQSGETTAARAILQDQIDQTTEPAELAIYRQLYFNTLQRDSNTTGAIEYMEKELAAAKELPVKSSLMLTLSNLYAVNDNYEKAREYLQEATNNFTTVLKEEVDRKAKVNMSLEMARAYLDLGNLPGARRVFQTVYEADIKDPQVLMPTVLGLAETLLRYGDTSATVAMFEDAHKKYPEAKFDQQVKGLLQLQAQGQLEVMAPQDTSTLAMKFKADPNVVWPSELPGLLGVQTTGTVTNAAETTATEAATAPIADATATTATASVATLMVTPEPVTTRTETATEVTSSGNQ